MPEEIYALAAALQKDDGADAAVLRALCRAAEKTLAAQLREEFSPEDCRDSFVTAAAMMAAGDYLEAAEQPKQFSVGDVSVRCERASAAALRKQAARLMAPFLKSGFSFLGVF